VLIGSHVDPLDPLAAAQTDDADVVQFFLGDPQSWKKPKPREDADVLRASSVPRYVHAPYLINVASANNRVRIPSRKILQDTCDAATEVGATAVIVHGGHADDKDIDAGFERWVKALDSLKTDMPVYLENTAGGDHAMARHFDTIARLWDHIGDKGIRHANFGTGQIDPQLLVAVVKAADAPVICETSEAGRKDDIAFLREQLG
jgi:deoxyribonuclease-4